MIRNRIGPLAVARGWSDRDLGHQAQLDRAHVNLLKNGRCRPSVATALAVANALGVAVAVVFPPGASGARRATSCRRS